MALREGVIPVTNRPAFELVLPLDELLLRQLAGRLRESDSPPLREAGQRIDVHLAREAKRLAGV